MSNYYIARATSTYSAKAFETAAARFANGTVAYGAVASVHTSATDWGSGKVWRQLNRTSGPLDISRAAGRAAPGFDGRWELHSYAICAAPRGGIQADGTVAPGAEASDRCDSGFTHGAGGGGGLVDGGPVWLQKIEPHTDLRGVDVALTGPLYPSIGGMVAHQTCAL